MPEKLVGVDLLFWRYCRPYHSEPVFPFKEMPMMNIFSTVEKQTQRVLDERLSLSVRLPVLLYLLLGRRPARHLAQSLIVILLLISPLSFSTDKVSNFTYECPVSCCGSEKTVIVVAQQRTAPGRTGEYAFQPVNRTLFPAPFFSPIS